ncbi:MAG: class I SAM-dependent methyltransferase [Candidatus Roizmanbacteria bacterium]|nr:class I SAM-dependent methyltransferase [Candidatus Roizmanbacteria bacterium]
MTKQTINENYWDKYNKGYGKTWNVKTRALLSKKELGFIQKYIPDLQRATILDVGVGTGRILNFLINKSKKDASIYGIDVSQKMVDYCKTIFGKQKKIKEIKRISLSKKKGYIFNGVKFSLISAIRVLKYNADWKQYIHTFKNNLDRNGVMIFTMPNRESLNKFAHYTIPFYKSDYKEIQSVLDTNNLELLDIQTFTRIPDIFYELPHLKNTNWYATLINSTERLLKSIFGAHRFGRILFIAARRK